MLRQTDSRTVKAMWSIVLGLAMILGQFTTTGATVPAGAAVACVDCSCAQLNCCATSTPSQPLSVPISNASDLRVQAPAVVVVTLASTPPDVSSATALLSRERTS